MTQKTSSLQTLASEPSTRKKSGPKNKLSKKKRLDDVRRLYFDEGYYVVDVAKTLGVHRNTVSSDVRFWLGQFDKHGLGDKMTEFFYKEKSLIESQKIRILKKLKSETDFEKYFKLEKLLISLYDREMKFYLKFQNNVHEYPIITTQLIKKLIRELALDDFSFLRQNELIREIIERKKYGVGVVHSIVNEIEKLGLDYVESESGSVILMADFAKFCGFISDDELSEIEEKRARAEEEEKENYEERLAKFNEDFIAKYGVPEEWSIDIQKQYKLEVPDE